MFWGVRGGDFAFFSAVPITIYVETAVRYFGVKVTADSHIFLYIHVNRQCRFSYILKLLYAILVSNSLPITKIYGDPLRVFP